MPPLDHFRDGKNEFPIVICLDATGYGNCQFNTIAVRNPYLSASAQHLRIFGLGNCSDHRKGSSRLLGENLKKINKIIRLSEGATVPDQCMPCEVHAGERVFIRPSVFIVTDTSCLRHCEHIAASG